MPQIDNPLQQYGQAMTLRNHMLQGDVAERGIADQDAQKRALIASGGDWEKAQKLLLGAGQGKAAMDVGKYRSDQQKSMGEMLERDDKLVKSFAEQSKGELKNITNDEQYQAFKSLQIKRATSLTTQQYRNVAMQKFEQMPPQFDPQWVQAMLAKTEGYATPDYKPINANNRTEFAQMNPNAPGFSAAPIRHGTSPDARVRAASTAPPAVTTTVIVDPANPARQLTVDARTYRGGSVGAPGVIGVSGKESDPQKREAKRQFSMQGIGAAIQSAENILKGKGGDPLPTESGVGTAYDYAASLIGASPKGAKQADQLRAIGGALVSKVPRMEGPQSDFDVKNYREMAGRVGDSSLPIARRIAALESVKELWEKYERLNPEAFAGGAGGAGGLPSAVDIDAEIARRRGGR